MDTAMDTAMDSSDGISDKAADDVPGSKQDQGASAPSQDLTDIFRSIMDLYVNGPKKND